MAQRRWVVDREFEIEGAVFPVGMEFSTGRLKKEVRDHLERRKCIHVEGDEDDEPSTPAASPGGLLGLLKPFNYEEEPDGSDQ